MNELERLEKIREWLRYHGDYSLVIEPWGIYGCWQVTLSKRGKQPLIDWGKTLTGRLDRIELWIAALDSIAESQRVRRM